jgi:endonuclease-3 related protein
LSPPPNRRDAGGPASGALPSRASARAVRKRLLGMFELLHAAYGPRHWWPGQSPFEVAVGAILTQNTNWGNVQKAIENLKKEKALTPRALVRMPLEKAAEHIRPAGYFNVKARRLQAFVRFLANGYGSMEAMRRAETGRLREQLLAVHGVGEETADSILLYALEKPVFVVDAYTRRVLSRHRIMDYAEPYGTFQALFHGLFARGGAGPRGWDTVPFFNEFHALFVQVGKDRCRPREPRCRGCALEKA